MASLDGNVVPGESYVVAEQPLNMRDHDQHAGLDVIDELFPKEELKEEDAPAPSLNGGEKDEDVPMDDLFGETEAIEDSGKATSTVGSVMADDDDGLSDTERQRRRALEYGEPEEEPEGQVFEEVIEANVEIPKVPIPKSSNGEHWVIRTPNFVKVDSRPFHQDTYVGPEQIDEELMHSSSARERSESIKLRVENTMRWRWAKDKDGNDIRRSNTRIIRWSDGTMSLRLGKEIFDIQKTTENVPRPGLPTSQSQSQSSPEKLNRGGAANGLTYLVQQHKRAGVLQAEAAITGTMALRPTGMKSETHRMLVGAVRQKHNKVARLRMTADPTVDPERELMEEIKRDSRNNKPRRNRQSREDDFDLGIDNPRNARKQRRAGGGGGRRRRGEDMYSDEDDEEEPQWSDEDHEDTSPRRKSKGDQDADGRRGGEYQPDDFLVADSDEAGSDDDKSRRKRKKRARDEQSDEDELDKLDAQIAKQQQARKAAGGGDGYDDGPQDEADARGTPEEKMDVESEEEDDDFNVRRAGGSSRRKRAFQEEEDDDQ